MTLMWFATLDAVKVFMGETCEVAYVADALVLSRPAIIIARGITGYANDRARDRWTSAALTTL
jgi:hypothetical protein